MNNRALFQRLVRIVTEPLDVYSSLLLRRQGPLRDDGWFRSFREGVPVDLAGQPLPWLTYPAIDFLSTRVDSTWRVFEYGCGYSTLWWASRVREVVAVDDNDKWVDAIAPRLPGSASVRLVATDSPDSYVDAMSLAGPPFDVVVVDGSYRPACLQRIPAALSAGGVIILDNSERHEYRSAIDELLAGGFRCVDFSGLVPVVCWKSRTSIFYRDNNCLGL